jgi:hypothetical protein
MAEQRPPIKPASLAEFKAAMKTFADEMNADLEAVEVEQMRLMMRDAMNFSAPMPAGGGRGLSVAAWKAGKNSLNNDVRRIFIAQDQPVKGRTVFLRQVINAVKGNDSQTFYELHQDVTPSRMNGLSPIMQKIMDDSDWRRAQKKAQNYLSKTNVFTSSKVKGMASDPRAIHDRAKGAVNGRWPKGQKYNGPQYFMPTTADLNAYIAKRQQKVGWVKAGYADALAKLPKTKTEAGVLLNYGAYDAPWVDANRSGFGYFTLTKTRGSVSGVVGNSIGNINGVADESDTKNIVYGLRVQNLEKAVKARAEKRAKKASKGKS